MNCREFRRKHDAYVDDTLSGVDIEAMGRHLRLCAHCAALDTRIRRSLLLAHNPAVDPTLPSRSPNGCKCVSPMSERSRHGSAPAPAR
jgi:hypothetical protein